MKQIPLTQGKFALVDDEDYEWLNQWKWYYSNGYAVRGDYSGGKRKTVWMHRVILSDELKPGMVCDHVNRVGVDNRRGNLRVCTQAENMRNSSSREGSSSGYLGVCAYGGKWAARIRLGSKQRHLGHYLSEEDAALAYNRAAIKAGLKFANLNPVVDDGRALSPLTRAVGKSGLRGATYKANRWQGQISINGKKKHLGYFDTAEEAHQAYLLAKQNR